jgi:DNA ligase-1
MAKREGAMLAEDFDPRSINPAGWHLSEKLNGIRGLWNGKNLISRNGNAISAPDWFTRGFPPNAQMDGELWLGRGKHLGTLNSIISDPRDSRWKQVQYMVFDVPDPQFGAIERRLEFVSRLVQKLAIEHVKYVPHTVCTGRDMLDKIFLLLAQQGAEGVMMVRPGSFYSFTRTTNLLKLKVFHQAEAQVFGYEKGKKGKSFEKLTGALWVRAIESSGLVAPVVGTEFKVGSGLDVTGSVSRTNPPPIGSIITYQFSELTASGKPFHPTFQCIRKDK